LWVAKLGERFSANKRITEKFDVRGFLLRKLNNAEVREQYQIKILNRFSFGKLG
jgi:hypothetical protein